MSIPGACYLCQIGMGSYVSIQHFFYNFVDPTQVHFYGRPSNAVNDAAWEKAVRENPDPSWYVWMTLHGQALFSRNPASLVPVLAVGLDDLQQRVEAQTKQAAEHQEKLKVRSKALIPHYLIS